MWGAGTGGGCTPVDYRTDSANSARVTSPCPLVPQALKSPPRHGPFPPSFEACTVRNVVGPDVVGPDVVARRPELRGFLISSGTNLKPVPHQKSSGAHPPKRGHRQREVIDLHSVDIRSTCWRVGRVRRFAVWCLACYPRPLAVSNVTLLAALCPVQFRPASCSIFSCS